MGQGGGIQGIVVPAKRVICRRWPALSEFPNTTNAESDFPTYGLLSKPSMQVQNDSNIPSGVSKWVPNNCTTIK